MSEFPSDLEVLGFQACDIKYPNRVYSHGHREGKGKAWYVAFSPVGEHYPVMFIYVNTFEEAVSLVREIAAATRGGNVDKYVGRWMREKESRD